MRIESEDLSDGQIFHNYPWFFSKNAIGNEIIKEMLDNMKEENDGFSSEIQRLGFGLALKVVDLVSSPAVDGRDQLFSEKKRKITFYGKKVRDQLLNIVESYAQGYGLNAGQIISESLSYLRSFKSLIENGQNDDILAKASKFIDSLNRKYRWEKTQREKWRMKNGIYSQYQKLAQFGKFEGIEIDPKIKGAARVAKTVKELKKRGSIKEINGNLRWTTTELERNQYMHFRKGRFPDDPFDVLKVVYGENHNHKQGLSAFVSRLFQEPKPEGGFWDLLKKRPRNLFERNVRGISDGAIWIEENRKPEIHIPIPPILQEIGRRLTSVFEPLYKKRQLALPAIAFMMILSLCVGGYYAVQAEELKTSRSLPEQAAYKTSIPRDWIEIISHSDRSNLGNFRFFNTSFADLEEYQVEVNGVTYYPFKKIMIGGLCPFWSSDDPHVFVDRFGRVIAETDGSLIPTKVYQAPGTPDGAREAGIGSPYWLYSTDVFDTVTDLDGKVIYQETPESLMISKLIDQSEKTILQKINSDGSVGNIFVDGNLEPVAVKFGQNRLLIKTAFKDMVGNPERHFWVEYENGEFTPRAFFIDDPDHQVGLRIPSIDENGNRGFKILYKASDIFESKGLYFEKEHVFDNEGNSLYVEGILHDKGKPVGSITFDRVVEKTDGMIFALATDELGQQYLYSYPERLKFYKSNGDLYAYGDATGKPRVFVEKSSSGVEIYVVESGVYKLGWYDINLYGSFPPDIIILPDGREAIRTDLYGGKINNRWQTTDSEGNTDQYTLFGNEVSGFHVVQLNKSS